MLKTFGKRVIGISILGNGMVAMIISIIIIIRQCRAYVSSILKVSAMCLEIPKHIFQPCLPYTHSKIVPENLCSDLLCLCF